MQTSKAAFLSDYDGYGYGGVEQPTELEGAAALQNRAERRRIDVIRREEFPQLKGSVYLDHAGATLYAKSQLQRSFDDLQQSLLGNPHSSTSSSPHNTTAASSDGSTASRVAAIRRRVLSFFHASEEEYAVVFTSGATAALKMVGECFPWSSESTFAHSTDSHTSVLGIRGYAGGHRGANIVNVPLDEMQRLEEQASALAASSPPISLSRSSKTSTTTANNTPYHLFAFPAECNFSGTRHDLDLVSYIQQHGFTPHQDEDSAAHTTSISGRWLVLLDAAKYVATRRLDLQAHKPDFVALSFYKMFGYPTGIGALLVHKKRAMPLLQKQYYGGGTVSNILASSDFVRLRGDLIDPARLEDGTVSFLSILALHHGLDQLQKLTMAAIERHTATLTQLLMVELQALKHWNGVAACQLYNAGNASSTCSSERRGPIVSCNFIRFDGSYVGYAEVGKLAAIHNIHLRTGCFCNPGACQWYLGLHESDLIKGMEAGHVCGDDVDIVDGLPTGAVRLSIGYMTTYEDIQALVAFAVKYFVAVAPCVLVVPHKLSTQQSGETAPVQKDSMIVLQKLVLYPIKSCTGMSVDAWPVGSRGLVYDREWAIIDASTRKALTLKDAPELCFLEPRVDLQRQTLTIRCRKSGESMALPLYASLAPRKSLNRKAEQQQLEPQNILVCMTPCQGRDSGEAASQWLSQRLQRACMLVRVAADSARATDAKIGFANQAQFLLISRASVAHVNASLRVAGADMQIQEDAFRANLVVGSNNQDQDHDKNGVSDPHAFIEDSWTRLRIGNVAFDVTGPCSRCSMVNIDPVTGAFHRAPLQVLSRYRRERANIFFGQFLSHTDICVPDGDSDPAATAASSSASSTSSSHSRVAWLRCGSPVNVEVARNPV